MRFLNQFIKVIILLLTFSCIRTNDNAEITFDSITEQIVTDSTNYLFPIKKFLTKNTDTLDYSIFFGDLVSKRILKCQIHKNSIAVAYMSIADTTIWPVNKIYKSHDSIYYFDNYSNRLNLQNISGPQLQTYQLDPKYAAINLLSGYEKNGISSLLMDNASKNIGMGSMEERLEYYNQVKPLLLIRILPETIEYKELGLWPKDYLNTGNSYNDPYAGACFGKNNAVCVSFGADHNMYLYHDTSLRFSKQVKSNYISNFEPYPDDKVFDMMYLREFMQKEPKYLDVIFDTWNNMYYRIAKPSLSNAMSGSKIERFWSIVVTDNELNVVGECKFSYKYDPRVFFPTPFGILLLKGNYPGSIEKTFTLIKLRS